MFRCQDAGLGGRAQWGSLVVVGRWIRSSLVGVKVRRVAETFLVTCGCFDLVCLRRASGIAVDLFGNFAV